LLPSVLPLVGSAAGSNGAIPQRVVGIHHELLEACATLITKQRAQGLLVMHQRHHRQHRHHLDRRQIRLHRQLSQLKFTITQYSM